VDVKAMTIRAVEHGRQSPIGSVARMNGQLLLQGVQGAHGWTLIIAEDTGQMSATIASAIAGYIIRSCTHWYHPTIRSRYETIPDRIRYVLIEVQRRFYAHPHVDSTSACIRFVGFGNSSLDLEAFSHVTVTDYGGSLEVTEDLNLRIMDIIAAAGTCSALPAPMTYFGEGRGLDPDRARAVAGQVHEWRERRELWRPRLPQEQIAELNTPRHYPADGSPTGPAGDRR
jgi:MscS family membrane protein